MTFRPICLVTAAALLVVEVIIARGYFPAAFVRNSIGDVLIIPLLYFLLRGLAKTSPLIALAASLIVGFIVEALQYIHTADLLGLQQGSLLYIALGNTFSSLDLLMYSIGGVLAVCLDLRVLQQLRPPPNAPQAR
jgi:hypothetical protein